MSSTTHTAYVRALSTVRSVNRESTNTTVDLNGATESGTAVRHPPMKAPFRPTTTANRFCSIG